MVSRRRAPQRTRWCVDANLLAIANQARGVLDADDGRQAVLTGDHGAVRHEAADLGDESTDRHEQR
jgi:hypothetical protein